MHIHVWLENADTLIKDEATEILSQISEETGLNNWTVSSYYDYVNTTLSFSNYAVYGAVSYTHLDVYKRQEKDILKLVNALIMNTKGEGEKSSEDFWVKAERLYYSALIGYIWYCLLYTSRCV